MGSDGLDYHAPLAIDVSELLEIGTITGAAFSGARSLQGPVCAPHNSLLMPTWSGPDVSGNVFAVEGLFVGKTKDLSNRFRAGPDHFFGLAFAILN